jgi:hypothetical protein
MSDQPTASPSANASEAKPSAKKARTPKGYTVPDIARAYLQSKGVRAPSDAKIEKTCKIVRGTIRAHKGELAKTDPAIKRHTKGADYGVLNAKTRDKIVKGTWKD